jgi:probable rRNA maturation factor
VIFIDVIEPFEKLIGDAVLHIAAETALLAGLDSGSASLTLRITDEDEIHLLNQQFRGLDQPTDVLSFPADFEDPDLESRYLGDIVICYPQAASQAEKRGHAVEDELQLLVVHGVLHLLGYDHATQEEKDRMWDIQAKILADLGVKIEVGEE